MISEFIDKIIYINLDRRKDRRQEIEQELDNFDLPYERFTAIDYPGFGIYGCGMSHLTVLKMAKERQYKNVLIFEDDFKFIVSKTEFEKTINSLFREPNRFDVCMFSYIIEKQEPDNNFSNFNRAISAITASGYLIQSHYYDTLIDLYSHYIPLLLETREHWNYANDQIWKKLQIKDKWLISNKRIGIQRPSFSDNSNCFQEYNY